MNQMVRQQLTLFVDKTNSTNIEVIRKMFNPKQYALIDSHVTLCREDELENITLILDNLTQINFPKITLYFGSVLRFENNHGVLLPALGENEAFHQLRLTLLANSAINIRKHEPHITLMHPRNSTCTDKIFQEIQTITLPTSLSFDTISLIEQVNGEQWQVLKEFKLNHFV